MDYLFAAIAILGHFAICIYVINRLHATALPHGVMKVIDLLESVGLKKLALDTRHVEKR